MSDRKLDERPDARPLVAHVLYRFDVGGLENGVVNLINQMPPERFRHAIIALTECTDYRRRIHRDDVSCHGLGMRPGIDAGAHLRLWRLLRQLRPAIVHTRNLAALEGQVAATLAGVRHRVHGEHGRDVGDLDGSNRRYRRVRRLLQPLVHRYIALSRDLERYLLDDVGIPAHKVAQVYNGVDTARFGVPAGDRDPVPAAGFAANNDIVIGTVGRMQAVKDQPTLVRAFIRLAETEPLLRPCLRLVMIGDGPLLAQSRDLLHAAGLEGQAWLPGMRDDVPAMLRAMDVFVLPSIAEGISNTILEAMACARPVLATRVGGNPELVEDGMTGVLVPAADPETMARALARYAADRELRRRHGDAGRRRVETVFGLDLMVRRYSEIYERLLAT